MIANTEDRRHLTWTRPPHSASASTTAGLQADMTVTGTYAGRSTYVYEAKIVSASAGAQSSFKWRKYLRGRRDGGGPFHAYDAATNALLEEAYRTQTTCRLPVPGMHLEVRFGAKATSDRVAVPPLSRIVQVNCGASNTPTRVVLRVEAGEDPAAVYCALGAAADTSEKKLRHRYARLVALDGSAEADVHILRREGAAHRCRFEDLSLIHI